MQVIVQRLVVVLVMVFAIAHGYSNRTRPTQADRAIDSTPSIASSSDVGWIRWSVFDYESGLVVSTGNRRIVSGELVVVRGDRGDVTRSVRLDDNFAFDLVTDPEALRKDLKGFGLAGRHGKDFIHSWRWYHMVSESQATGIQDGSRISVMLSNIDSEWDITRMEFLDDATVELSPISLFGDSAPRWSLRLGSGSFIKWP